MPASGGQLHFHPAADRRNQPRHAQLLDRMLPYEPQLRGYLRHRWAASETDDCVQDVYLRLLQCELSRTVEFPKRYLFQVANAVMVDRRRRARSRCASLHRELTHEDHPHDDRSPLRILLAREAAQAAQAALNTLPARTRDIIFATRLESASIKSMAARYGISISAVEKHIGRALRTLSATPTLDTSP
ncbi:MAG TPA: RNA polymerase sigma factor [Steroidobacter sp.]|uniref:RNA polymerase sigma factor n=1 Tax=Steroidobacter sp. TaxID=1978227 RepID=UPI002EDADB8F